MPSQEKGIEIKKDGNNQILLLSACKNEDASIYTILATNKLGKCHSKSELIVKC